MTRPLIGITAGHGLGAAKPQRRQDVVCQCGKSVVAAVTGAGGVPVLLPPVGPRAVIRPMLEAIDGLLLPGGGDPSALEFGAEPHPNIRYVDPPRDRMELAAVRLALRRGMPILGICRGIQVINIALGGGLVQDIAAEFEQPVRHWAFDLTPSFSHTIDVEPFSLLASLIGVERVAVSSIHHQSVGRLGRGLRVTAYAPDGVIEAIEADDGRPVLGVQFHPEENAPEHERFAAIFGWLVKQARRYRRANRTR